MEIDFAKIIGHETQKKQLLTMLREQRLPHALLFTGPSGVGKKMVARALAAAILCQNEAAPCGHCESCLAMKADSQLNYYEIVPEKRGKSVSVIRIEQIRAIQTKVSRTTTNSGGSVVVIDSAEQLNEAAANCLLKTLEEPSGKVTFILITTAKASLLDTIISRCMLFSFGSLPLAAMEQVLLKKGIPEAMAKQLPLLADGSLGRAIAMYSHDGLQLREAAADFLQQLTKWSMLEVWINADKQGAWDRDKLMDWLVYVNMLLRDTLVLYEDGASKLLYNIDYRDRLINLVTVYNEPQIFAMLNEVRNLQQRLQANVNLRLQLEGFFIRMIDINN